MSIYLSAPVEEMPDVVLSCWSIREDNEGLRYFVGFNEITRDGRVSTPIQLFDAEQRIGFTRSGRRYILVGRGGWHEDGDYVWNLVVRAWNLGEWRDVTAELVPTWRTAMRSTTLSGADVPDTTLMPIFWSVRAYEFITDAGSLKLRLLSEVRGDCRLPAILGLRCSTSEMYLYATRAMLHAREQRGGSIVPGAQLPWHLKIWVAALDSLEDRTGRPVARLDAYCSCQCVRATVCSTDWTCHEIRPFSVAPTDGVWEVFLRAMAAHERPRQ